MTSTADTLQLLTSKLLSDWAMVFVEQVADIQEVYQGQRLRCATIGFSSAINRGRVYLLFDERLSETIVANVLGIPDDRCLETTVEAHDAMLELVNMLGNYLASTFVPDDLQVHVTLPTYCAVPPVSACSERKHESIERTYTILRADGTALLVIYELEEAH